MLRVAVLLLLLANAGYFAWAQGLLSAWGVAPAQPSEPQRLQQQINPQALRIMRDEEARFQEAEPLALAQAECLLAGPIADAQLFSVRRALQAWPAGSWTLEAMAEPAPWIVYLGRYEDAEQVARKQVELRQIGIAFETPADPALEPGLSLGRYPTEAAAGEQLRALALRGVRSAKVVRENAPPAGQLLRLLAVDDGVRVRIAALRPVLHAIKLRPCR